MARRSPARRVTYFEPVPPRLARNTIIELTLEVGRRFRCTMRVALWPARPRRCDPAGTRRMAPAHARAPRRRGARGLAGWPQCGLSARRTDNRRAPCGCRSISRQRRLASAILVLGPRLALILASPIRAQSLLRRADAARRHTRQSLQRAMRTPPQHLSTGSIKS